MYLHINKDIYIYILYTDSRHLSDLNKMVTKNFPTQDGYHGNNFQLTRDKQLKA